MIFAVLFWLKQSDFDFIFHILSTPKKTTQMKFYTLSMSFIQAFNHCLLQGTDTLILSKILKSEAEYIGFGFFMFSFEFQNLFDFGFGFPSCFFQLYCCLQIDFIHEYVSFLLKKIEGPSPSATIFT